MQDNQRNTVSIYEVKKLDSNNKILNTDMVTETELIHNITSRNDLYQAITKKDIVELIEKMKSQEEELGKPISFFLLNKQNTQCDICTFIKKESLH